MTADAADPETYEVVDRFQLASPYHRRVSPVATHDDASAEREHEHEAEMESSTSALDDAETPAWFAPALAVGMAIELDPLKCRMGKLERRMDNQQRRQENRAIYEACNEMHGFMLSPLRRYIRVHGDYGDGVPGLRHLTTDKLPGGLDFVTVGQEIPSPPFPRSLQSIVDMTDEQINYLAMLLHTDFSIVERDNDAMRRHKVLLYFGLGAWIYS